MTPRQIKTPQLRFPEFTDEWQVNKLGDIADFFDGKRVPIESVERQGMQGIYPYYGASGIIDYVDKYIFDGEYILLAEDGANILMRSSPVAFLAKGKFWLNNHAHIMQAHGSNMYLATYLERLKYDSYNTGTTQPKLNAAVVKKININIPSIPEQQKIADYIAGIDTKLTSIQAKVATMYEYKKGVMQALFSGKLRFEDENGNLYPDWKMKRLSDIFEEVTDRVGDSRVETYSITAGHGFISQAKKFGKDISGMQNERYTLLDVGHFAYNKGNSKQYTYGCIYANHEGKRIAVPNVFISFKLRDDAMAVNYFQELFKSHYLDRHLRKIISSGARMDGLLNVSKKAFFDIEILVPDSREQQKIADFLTAVDDKIKLEEAKLASAKEFKKALLQKMLI